jgi:hypothetical protein
MYVKEKRKREKKNTYTVISFLSCMKFPTYVGGKSAENGSKIDRRSHKTKQREDFGQKASLAESTELEKKSKPVRRDV